jgi:hypothetical protein
MKTVAIVALYLTALSVACVGTSLILLFVIRLYRPTRTTLATMAGFLATSGILSLLFATALALIVLPATA